MLLAASTCCDYEYHKMLPGLPAIVALVVAAAIGKTVGNHFTGKYNLQDLGQLASHSVATCVVSAAFWAWAAYKLLSSHHPDFGVVSFLVAFTASYRTADLCAVQLAKRGGTSKRAPPLAQQARLHPLALLFVSANYVAALLVAPIAKFPPTFTLYLVLGAASWAAAAMHAKSLLDDALVDSLPRHALAAERERLATHSGEAEPIETS